MGIGEDAAPGAADVNRDDRVISALDDALEAAAEFAQHAVAGQLPLGEDTDHVAIIHGGPGLLHELQQSFFAILRRNRNDPQKPEQAPQQGCVVDAALHDKADPALIGGGQQQGIHPGDMVGNQQCRSLHRQVLSADDAQAVEDAHADKRDEAQQEIGQHPEGDQGKEQGDDADGAESLGCREPQWPAQEPGQP